MNDDGDLDYALARIAALRSRRMGDPAWRALDGLRAYGAVLAAARNGGLGRWVGGIDERAGARAIEAALATAWRGELARLMAWMPRNWRPALEACATWVDLPRRRAEAARAHGLAPSVDAAWRERLLSCLRAAGATDDPAFARLARLLLAHQARFAAWPPGNGWPLRAELERSLLGFMHLAPTGAAAVFAWVALLALEHERLRGALASRVAREAAA